MRSWKLRLGLLGGLLVLAGCAKSEPGPPEAIEARVRVLPSPDTPPEVPGFTWLRNQEFSALGKTHAVHVYRFDRFAKRLQLDKGATDPSCEFVLIPGGELAWDEPSTNLSIRNPRTLTPYLIARTELTLELFGPAKHADFELARGPVESVSWNRINTIAHLLGMRFPSEAEWDFACFAGTLPAGSPDRDQAGWTRSNSGGAPREVATLQPNAFGLFDMRGNVWEWCAAEPVPAMTSKEEARSNYVRALREQGREPPTHRPLRRVRGGGWKSSPAECESGATYPLSKSWGLEPGDWANDIGVRLVKSLPVDPR